LGTTPERRDILNKYLDFRARLNAEGLINGFQWLDGSFLEDVETIKKRPPGDLDLVTVYWGYSSSFSKDLATRFPEFASHIQSKAAYKLDHFPFDAGYSPDLTLELTRYWILLFSHSRMGVWKGMLKINLNTPAEDDAARLVLATHTP